MGENDENYSSSNIKVLEIIIENIDKIGGLVNATVLMNIVPYMVAAISLPLTMGLFSEQIKKDPYFLITYFITWLVICIMGIIIAKLIKRIDKTIDEYLDENPV